MSSGCKPKPRCFGSDIHKLLLAAEAGQKADILVYSSGHLGPGSLNQSQLHKEKRVSFWRMSQTQKETPIPLTLQRTQQTMALSPVKKKEIKESLSEFSSGPALPENEGLRSREGQASDHSSHKRKDKSLPNIVYCSSKSLLVQPKGAFTKKVSNSSSDSERKRQFCANQSDQEDLNKGGQLMMKQYGRKVIANHGHWGGVNVTEMHEKLQKELEKLSAQSWPSRDRLVVFSDVFADVCEASQVFGRILREIKTDYDLYVNHLMASHSSLLNTSPTTSLEDCSNGKLRELALEDAEKEVCILEQEARKALEENKRVRNELQSVPALIGPEDSGMQNASLSGLNDRGAAIGCTGSVQSMRLQVLTMWSEIQQMEEDIKDNLVYTATTMATERLIRDQKADIMTLMTSNDHLKTTNKDLENNINMVLNREKASKFMRRMLWEEIHCDPKTESE